MSDLTGLGAGADERLNEGLPPNVNTGERSPVDARVSGDESEEGEVKDDHPVSTKRQRSPSIEEQRSIEEQPSPKRTKPTEDSGIASFNRLRNPADRIPCVFSIDEQEPFGTLYPTSNGFATMLFIDAGRYGPPAISLGFRNNGTGGKDRDRAQSGWDTRSNYLGHWAMSDVQHGYATPEATDSRMSNPVVLGRCRTQDMGDFLYMRFRSWPQGTGFCDKDAFKSHGRDLKKSMDTIFLPKRPYLVELWFLAPFKATDFRRHCLRSFTEILKCRYDFSAEWKDGNGNYFGDMPVMHPPSHYPKPGGTIFRVHVATGQRTLPTTAPAQSRGGNTSHQAEQSAAENSLEAEHMEDKSRQQ